MNSRLGAILIALVVVCGCSKPTPGSPRARGIQEFKEGRWSEAIEALSEAITTNPLDSEAYLYRGQAYLCQGREFVSQAIADYNEAIRLNPDNYEAYYHRAIAYRERGDRQKALADDAKARQMDPNAASAGNLFNNSMSDYRVAIEHAAERNSSDDATGTESTHPVIERSAPENLPLPATKLSKPSGPITETDTSELPDSKVSGRFAPAPEIRDAFGLPVAPPRTGSVTEELFGFGTDGLAEDVEEMLPKPRLGQARRRKPPADWQATDPEPTAPPLDAAPPVARRSSPVGTLPFGNPFQPQTRGYSPYAPTGPRSTGLQGDPTQRSYQQSPGYQPRYNPYAPPVSNEALLPPGPGVK